MTPRPGSFPDAGAQAGFYGFADISRVREPLRHGGEKRPEWRTNQTKIGAYQPLAA
jgi:hypothetical protein